MVIYLDYLYTGFSVTCQVWVDFDYNILILTSY